MTARHGIVIRFPGPNEMPIATCEKCGRELLVREADIHRDEGPAEPAFLRITLILCPGPHDAEEAVEDSRARDLAGTVYGGGPTTTGSTERDKMRQDPQYRLDPTI